MQPNRALQRPGAYGDRGAAAERWPPPGAHKTHSLVRGRWNSVRTELTCENPDAIEKELDTSGQRL